MITDKINDYVNDPENPVYNYSLGKEYELLQQYSAAAGYFLRAADRTEDEDLLYKSIVSAAKSFIEHGDNFNMAFDLLNNAFQIDNNRSDALNLLCLLYKYIGDEGSFDQAYSRFLRANDNDRIYDTMNFAKVIRKDIQKVDTVRHSEDQPHKDFKQKIQKEYTIAATTPSDINEHLPILKDLANECDHITEMGVRTGVSTRAFLMSNAKLISYDLVANQKVVELINEARTAGKNATFIEADVLKIDIEETDLLFIDTWHEYEQLKQELARHANKARKYIAFHDTNTYGLKNEGGDNGQSTQGLLPAIIEFLIENRNWQFKLLRTNNNGLTVIERVTV